LPRATARQAGKTHPLVSLACRAAAS
jgi:hypothetical protein